MELIEVEAGTRLEWKAEVTCSGAIASVGGRLLQGAADKTTQQVFARVKEQLEPVATPLSI